jgi:hypothetical protein
MQSLACHRLLRRTTVASEEEDQWAKNIESHAKQVGNKKLGET